MALLKRQDEIIVYLYTQKKWYTGNELAHLFHVSLRTIRNDISIINMEKSDCIISNKNKGYHISDSFVYNEAGKAVYMSNEQRIHHLLLFLLIHNQEEFSYYDLADDFFISEYTMLHDLETIKNILTEYSQFDIFIVRKDEFVYALNQNNNASLLLNAYFQNNDLYNQILDFQPCFLHVNLKSMKQHINSRISPAVFNRYLTYNSLLIISSVLTEQFICYEPIPVKYKDTQFQSYLYQFHDFFCSVAAEYSITDDAALESVFDSLISPFIRISMLESDIKQQESTAAPAYADMLHILKEVKKQYNLDLLSNEKLIFDLMTHLKTALIRIQNGIHINNPLLEHIRMNYTFLFDVAYFISNMYSKQQSLQFTNIEISYLVVYLIGPLKSLREDLYESFALDILLYVNEGYAILKNLKEMIADSLHDISFKIQPVVTYAELENKTAAMQYDLLITTSPNISFPSMETISISSALSSLDLANISKVTLPLFEIKQAAYFNRVFSYFFNDAIMDFHNTSKTVSGFFHQSCDKLKELHYVHDNFYSQLMEREELLSTSFETGIALPHSTENNARKSGILFAKFDTPIQWQRNKIKCAFLIVTAKEDIHLLNIIYKVIVDISSSHQHINQLYKCQSSDAVKDLIFTHFKEILK